MSLPTYVAMTQDNENIRQTPEPYDIVTMDHMRSLVPSLVALGWDDFFLGRADEIQLSTSQGQQLFFLGLEFVETTRRLEERVKEAELELYDKLDRDRVSARDIEEQARWVGALRGELVVFHWRYLLRAINVLNHEQHQKLVASLKLQTPLNPPRAAPCQRFVPGMEPSDAGSRVILHAAQFQKGREDIWVREKADPCRVQATVSVRALLGYEQGREAANRLIKLSQHLRKIAGVGSPIDKESARKVAAQMQPELWLMESTTGELQLLILRMPTEQLAQLGERLRTDSLGENLSKVTQELNRDLPGANKLAQYAKQIEQLASEWRKNVKRAAEKLCLAPTAATFLQ
jgi:hypothetical protein